MIRPANVHTEGLAAHGASLRCGEMGRAHARCSLPSSHLSPGFPRNTPSSGNFTSFPARSTTDHLPPCAD